MVSLVAMGSRARGLSSCDFQALELRLNSSSHGLSCSLACGMFPDHESNPCLLHLGGTFFTPEPPGKPHENFYASKFDNLVEIGKFLESPKLPRLNQEEIEKLNTPKLYPELNFISSLN